MGLTAELHSGAAACVSYPSSYCHIRAPCSYEAVAYSDVTASAGYLN